RIAAALRPGGRFVAEMGGARNTELVYSALRDALERHGVPRAEQVRPWYFPTPGEYATLLERHGLEVRTLWYFDRLTPLAPGEHTLSDWLSMFASQFVEPLPESERTAVVSEIEDAIRARLYIEGHWHVDY